jgi:hypothetical protein
MRLLYHSYLIYILIACQFIIKSFGQDPGPLTIESIPLPDSSFNRISCQSGSFASWLHSLPLKPKGFPVLDYRGRIYKEGTDSTVAAVINWNMQGKRLEQCMDILVRFYSEYLWDSNREERIVFPLPGGYSLKWNDWKRGKRPYFKGVDVQLKHTMKPDSSRASFEKYLRTVFAESHTQQFYFAYQPIASENVQIGDFIVKRGSKSHAVMIVDLAWNDEGDTIALIGHGDTPACQFYLLNYRKNNPWIPLYLNKEKLPLPIRRTMTWDGLRRFTQ